MFITLIGATTLAALGQSNANYYAKDQVRSPQIIELRAGMINDDLQRGQIRFSNDTQGSVVAISGNDGSIQWESSDREKLGGQNAPELIYVQMFDGVFAIDPFQPLPAANDATAQMLFRGTTLETDRTQHGRQYIDRTKELFTKLEQARVNWLRDNGYYGVRVIVNPKPFNDAQANANELPEPSAVFERPTDAPRVKSREQVKVDDKSDDQVKMQGVVAMILDSDEPIRISLPHMMDAQIVARVEKRNEQSAEQVESKEVASKN